MQNQSIIGDIVKNIEKVIIGKTEVIEFAMITLLAEGHLLLEDVPGVGKTTLANAISRSIHCGFNRIQFTPDTLPSDITGVSIYNMQTGKFEFTPGAIMNHIILADEVNRTSPKTQASLLEAMEEKQISVDGKTYPLPCPFMVIATQNPIDYLGTYNLPEAQLDRFLMKLSIGYPSKTDEKRMADYYIRRSPLKSLEPVADGKTISAMQEEVKRVKVHNDLIAYMIDIIDGTRNDTNITLGASPRATLALIRTSQAAAYYSGREYCIPDDILKVIHPVIRHRLILSPEARLNKQTSEKVLDKIIAKFRVPILPAFNQ
ncbi:AAA family ATPase [Anaerocolumna sp. MB42-C2]|uniref:AAA family ATPase n=1 Tax=Anaerocolumna sp. MB42-C2 TaxID=3070997 RepID=UPI0027E1E6B0|nr:MoxR family ATPase [Anaerocolumna sp. MB42-C2]WMJ85271.1 MoxR family ATPase [Anaerocolumna sp. MB42-C2]